MAAVLTAQKVNMDKDNNILKTTSKSVKTVNRDFTNDVYLILKKKFFVFPSFSVLLAIVCLNVYHQHSSPRNGQLQLSKTCNENRFVLTITVRSHFIYFFFFFVVGYLDIFRLPELQPFLTCKLVWFGTSRLCKLRHLFSLLEQNK